MKNLKTLFIIFAWVLAFCFASAETHVVEKGETLKNIAEKYNVSVDKIIELNPDAAQFIYVGMELEMPNSPIRPAANASANSPYQNSNSGSATYYRSENNSYLGDLDDEFENDRKTRTYELGFSAYSFDNVKESCCYGISMQDWPWKIANRCYLGACFDFFATNMGIVDKGSRIGKSGIGPSICYYFTPTAFISAPVVFEGAYSLEKGADTNVTFGLTIKPRIHFGKKAGIFVGPLLSFAFVKNSKADFGFNVGIYF